MYHQSRPLWLYRWADPRKSRRHEAYLFSHPRRRNRRHGVYQFLRPYHQNRRL